MNQSSRFSRRKFLAGTAATAGVMLASSLRGRSALAAAPAAGATPDRKLGVALVGIGSLTTGQLIPALTGKNIPGSPTNYATGNYGTANFTPTKYCKLVAFVTGHRERNLPLAEKLGIAPQHVYTYENFESIKDNPEVDIIYVVTPNSIHKENVLTASKLGKHVLCEKPMANSLADCQAMIDAMKAAKKELMIGYRKQHEPLTLKLIEMCRDKEKIGKISRIEATCNSNRTTNRYEDVWRIQKPISGGGALMDMGIYALQAVRYLGGEEPTEVNTTQYIPPDGGTTGPFRDIERAITFELKFPSGMVGVVSSTYTVNGHSAKVTAEKGTLELNPLMGYTGDRAYYTPTGGERTEVSYTWAHHFVCEMDEFAQRLMAGKPPKTAGDEGLRDMKIILAAYESAKTGKPVKLV